jgi:hypothetical protein
MQKIPNIPCILVTFWLTQKRLWLDEKVYDDSSAVRQHNLGCANSRCKCDNGEEHLSHESNIYKDTKP